MRGAERVLRGLCTKGEWGRDFIMGDMRAWRHISLFDRKLYTLQTPNLLPRDEGGLYNSLNYRRLRSFLLGQRTDTGDRVRMTITVCRDTTPFTFPFSHFRLSYPHPLSSPKLGRMKPLEK